MGETGFSWDEVTDGLIAIGESRVVDEQTRGKKGQASVTQASNIYSPHAYLILHFQESLNPSEQIKFRRHYHRKIAPTEADVVILQDIKDLVLFLLVTPITPQFISFFHLSIVDRFLRALIIYFQYYVDIWEALMRERAATMKKAMNPLAGGNRVKYASEMHTLRCMLGREYADIVVGCQDTVRYHHMTAGKKNSSTITQSQGEKDLRIFEVLISIAHRIIWIALQRKHFTLIEVELHRLFRTNTYNTAERRSGGHISKDTLENDRIVLQGSMVQFKTKLLRNSPLLEEILYSDCKFPILSLGIADIEADDPCICYLRNALVLEEEKLPEFGVKVGILGHDRSKFDVMLMPIEDGTSAEVDQIADKDVQEMKDDRLDTEEYESGSYPTEKDIIRMPQLELVVDLNRSFPVETHDTAPKGYKHIRETAKIKWISRELKRQPTKSLDTYSASATD